MGANDGRIRPLPIKILRMKYLLIEFFRRRRANKAYQSLYWFTVTQSLPKEEHDDCVHALDVLRKYI